jgi:response regulator RpfG family c-di-GMP phosphodiesterase
MKGAWPQNRQENPVKEKILFVDDDLSVLEGYRRVLHEEFQPDTAVGGEDGLDAIAKAGPYAVVVSDMRMPTMDGVQFLSCISRISPNTVRVMLTGYGDLQSAIGAVNEGHIFRFLTKPCEADVLNKTLIACLVQYRLVTAEKELLEQTLTGSIKVLTDVLSLANPAAFSRAARIRRYVQHLAAQLGLDARWQYEIAAMLSQLGCIALPSEIIEAAYCGKQLSRDEQTAFDMHPSVARNLLGNIPRLDCVAWMVGQQRFGAAVPDAQVSPSMRIGADILRVAIALDDLKINGHNDTEAFAKLKQDPQFDPTIVIALRSLPAESGGMESKAVRIPDLFPGMILQEEIRTKGEVLVAGNGQEVTYPLIVRLNHLHQRGKIPGEVLVLDPSHSQAVANIGSRALKGKAGSSR